MKLKRRGKRGMISDNNFENAAAGDLEKLLTQQEALLSSYKGEYGILREIQMLQDGINVTYSNYTEGEIIQDPEIAAEIKAAIDSQAVQFAALKEKFLAKPASIEKSPRRHTTTATAMRRLTDNQKNTRRHSAPANLKDKKRGATAQDPRKLAKKEGLTAEAAAMFLSHLEKKFEATSTEYHLRQEPSHLSLYSKLANTNMQRAFDSQPETGQRYMGDNQAEWDKAWSASVHALESIKSLIKLPLPDDKQKRDAILLAVAKTMREAANPLMETLINKMKEERKLAHTPTDLDIKEMAAVIVRNYMFNALDMKQYSESKKFEERRMGALLHVMLMSYHKEDVIAEFDERYKNQLKSKSSTADGLAQNVSLVGEEYLTKVLRENPDILKRLENTTENVSAKEARPYKKIFDALSKIISRVAHPEAQVVKREQRRNSLLDSKTKDREEITAFEKVQQFAQEKLKGNRQTEVLQLLKQLKKEPDQDKRQTMLIDFAHPLSKNKKDKNDKKVVDLLMVLFREGITIPKKSEVTQKTPVSHTWTHAKPTSRGNRAAEVEPSEHHSPRPGRK